MNSQAILENNWVQIQDLGKPKSRNLRILQTDIKKRSLKNQKFDL